MSSGLEPISNFWPTYQQNKVARENCHFADLPPLKSIRYLCFMYHLNVIKENTFMLLIILGYVRLIPIVVRGVLCCVSQQMLSYSLKSLRTLSFY